MRKGFTGDGDLECHQILYVKRCLKERGFSDLSLPNIQEGMEPEFDHRSCDEYRGLLRKGQQEIGSLLWASQRTRPDIAAVTGVCGTSTKSKEWSHQAWRYLAATLEHKVVFDRSSNQAIRMLELSCREQKQKWSGRYAEWVSCSVEHQAIPGSAVCCRSRDTGCWSRMHTCSGRFKFGKGFD